MIPEIDWDAPWCVVESAEAPVPKILGKEETVGATNRAIDGIVDTRLTELHTPNLPAPSCEAVSHKSGVNNQRPSIYVCQRKKFLLSDPTHASLTFSCVDAWEQSSVVGKNIPLPEKEVKHFGKNIFENSKEGRIMANNNAKQASGNKVLECSFSLLSEGRKYSGQHRKYIINNAREICYAPETRERIKLREALGYYGHGRRILCGKMNLQEVDVITLPDGTQAMVSNIPSNVTVSFDVDEDGTVRHKQEILDTETGKIVVGLNNSKVGGFSWACPAEDGGTVKPTHLTGFSGFDYVLQPGFSKNRGYVLENARNTEQMILESVAAVVKDDKRAAQMVAGWKLADNETFAKLEDAVFESESKLFELQDNYRQLKDFYTQAVNDRDTARNDAQHVKDNFKFVLESIQKSMPFIIPESVMDAMLEGDFDRAKVIFENASRIDYAQYPLFDDDGNCFTRRNYTVPNPLYNKKQKDPSEFGTAQYGFELNL